MKRKPEIQIIKYDNNYYLCYYPVIRTKWDKIRYNIRYIIFGIISKKSYSIIRQQDQYETSYIVMKLMK